MARVERADRNLANQLDEIEQRMFLLKILYDKYFSGLERIEPVREREELRRMIRDVTDEPIRNATQRFKHQSLKARYQSFELYWTRNLVQMERGTHPKMRFHADQKARLKREQEAAAAAAARPPGISPEQEQVLRERQERMQREEAALRLVYEKYVEARVRCGQSGDLAFDGFRDALRKQVRTIKSQFNCETVKFRVVVEEGRAKVKAVPIGGG